MITRYGLELFYGGLAPVHKLMDAESEQGSTAKGIQGKTSGLEAASSLKN